MTASAMCACNRQPLAGDEVRCPLCEFEQGNRWKKGTVLAGVLAALGVAARFGVKALMKVK